MTNAVIVLVVLALALIAAAYLLTPLREKYDLQGYVQANHRQPCFLTVDGHVLHYSDSGPATAPVILLLHGFAASDFTWRQQVPALLNAGFRVVALDHLGFGGSARVAGPAYSTQSHADLALGTLDALNIERAHIIGHSYGARVAMQVSIFAPTRVQSIIAIAPEVFVNERPPIAKVVGAPAIGYTLAFYSTMPEWTNFGLRLATGPDKSWITPEVIDGYAAPLRVKGNLTAQIWQAKSPKDGRLPVPQHVQTIQQPTLLLWGTHDAIFPVSDAQRLQQMLPACELQIFDTGHVVHEEQPDAFNSAALQFYHSHFGHGSA